MKCTNEKGAGQASLPPAQPDSEIALYPSNLILAENRRRRRGDAPTILFGHSQPQPPLPGFELVLPDCHRHTLGYAGEMTAARLLTEAGYRVVKAFRYEGDLKAQNRQTGELFRVEVKTAMRGGDGKWRFLLFKKSRFGVTDYRHSDIVILLAVVEAFQVVPFVVPVESLGRNRVQLAITSHPLRYAGWLATFRCDGIIRLESDVRAADIGRESGGDIIPAHPRQAGNEAGE